MTQLGKKFVRAQLEDIKSATRKAKEIPLVTKEELLVEISENKKRITQLERDCTALIIDKGEKDGVIKRLKEENAKIRIVNKKQEDELL